MRETPQTLQGSPPGLRGQHLLHRPRLIGLPDGKERCDTAIPSDAVPDSVLVVHDLERGDRALMPILDLEQNRLQIVGHGFLTFAGSLNFNGLRGYSVGEVSLAR